MLKLFLVLFILAGSAGSAAAHGDIAKLPDSVQIMQYKMLLYMDANDADIKNKLAMAYFRTGKLTEASEELKAVLTGDAVNFDALDGMGIVLLKQENGAEALKHLEKARSINDKDVMVHVHLYLAYQLLNKADLAQESLKKAESLASTPEASAEIQNEIKLLSKP